jgi:hypothetical protein
VKRENSSSKQCYNDTSSDDKPSNAGPAAEGLFLQSLATIACSTGIVDRGTCLCTARQYLSCASVCGLFVVFCHCYRSMAKGAGKDVLMVPL